MSILLYVLIAILILDIIVLAWSLIFAENLKIFFGTFVVYILIYVCIYIYKLINKKDLSKLYQEKVEAVEKANRELRIFLIEHQEFKKND